MQAASLREDGGQLTTARVQIAAVLVSRTRHICRSVNPLKCNDFKGGAPAAFVSASEASKAGTPSLKAEMIESSAADWTSDLSRQIRALIHAGADDDQLDRLILSRKSGNQRLVSLFINEIKALQSSERHAWSETKAGDLKRLQSQTLSLVVSTLSPTQLYVFIRWLRPLSELLHNKYRFEPFWSHPSAQAIMAKALCDDVLSRIETNSHEVN